MKSVSLTINLVILIFLTTINSIFLFEISKDKELGDFYYKGVDLSDDYIDIEVNHMHEVKDLVNAFLVINVISLILFLFSKDYSPKNIQLAGFSLLVLSILLIIASISFEAFFNQWHEIFFASDDWLLPAEAKLIQDYPLDYFRNKFIFFDSLLAFFGALMLILNNKKIFKFHR